MIILSPKTNFLGGALVSASHLGKLFPGRLYTWEKTSPFLEVNGIRHWILDPHALNLNRVHNSIFCIDTFLEDGYNPSLDHKYQRELYLDGKNTEGFEYNKPLYEFLSLFKNVHLYNHQPINRLTQTLVPLLEILVRKNCNITIYNHRAWWNEEFKNELGILFPDIKLQLMPYHYYLLYADRLHNYTQFEKNQSILLIGRSNSKCKIPYILKESNIIPTDNYLMPDIECSNQQFLLKLSKSDSSFIGTGYYYGGEGTPEMDVPYNKLEWSAIDALLAYKIPITSSLFSKELERLNINLPLLDYNTSDNHNNVLNLLKTLKNYDYSKLCEYRNIIIEQLQLGNKILSKLMDEA